MAALRPFIALSLALMLALTSGAMAIARGQTQAAGTMVLCIGSGSVTVQIDADGQPIGPVHICPDCALGLFVAAAPDPAMQPQPVETATALTATPPPATTSFLLRRAPRARAPPAV